MSDVQEMGGQASESSSLNTYKTTNPEAPLVSCATVLTNTVTKTFTVDFGTTPTLCQDGRSRSGMLIFDYSTSTNNAKFYRNPGFRCVITSQNYVVDTYTVNITNKTIANTTPTSIATGTNPGTNLTWSISANVNIVKPSGGGTITWNCTRTKTLLNTGDPNCYKGQSLPIDWSIAQVELNGSSSGTTAGGDSYSCTLSNLKRDFACRPWAPTQPYRSPFISGSLSFTPGTKKTRVIDYGTGACDKVATLTIGSWSTTLNL
jgi:hypothetical protein